MWGDHCVPQTCPPGTIRNGDGYCVPDEETCPDGMLSTPSGCQCPDGKIPWDDSYCVPEECPLGSIRDGDGYCVPICGDDGVLLDDGSCIPEGGMKFQILVGSTSILYWHSSTCDDDQVLEPGYFEMTVTPANFPLIIALEVLPGGADPTVNINVALPVNYLSLPESQQQWYFAEWCPMWDGSPAWQWEPSDYAFCGEGSGWDVPVSRIWARFPTHD